MSRLLRGIRSNHNGDFYSLNCFHSYRTDNKLKKHERVCNEHDYCHVEMATEDNKILKYNHGEKSLKAPFTIYVDLECLLPKMRSCQNNPEKSYIDRKVKRKPSGYSFVHSMQQKTNTIFIEKETVLKSFVKILKGLQLKYLIVKKK